MVKKVLVTALVLFGFVFSAMTEDCTGADAAGLLEQARQARMQWHLDQTEAIYGQILTDYPESSEAQEAKKLLAKLHIERKSYSKALKELRELEENYSGDTGKLAHSIYKVARKFDGRKRFQLARDIYQRIIRDYPGYKDPDDGISLGIKAEIDIRKMGIQMLFDAGRQQDGMSAVDKLISDFSNNPYVPKALLKVARKLGKYGRQSEQAQQIYQRITEHYPDSECVPRTQMRLEENQIVSLISNGDYSSARQALNDFINNYGNKTDMTAEASVHRIAHTYEDVGRYDEAVEIYGKVSELFSGTEKAYRAQLDVRKVQIMVLVKAGKDAEVQVEIDRFVADFPSNSYVPVALSGIAELYWDTGTQLESQGSAGQARSYYENGLSVWKKVIYELPDCIGTGRAWLNAGQAYQKLGDYDKAIQCYQKIVNDRPLWRLAWHATFLLGRTYEELKSSGAMSEADADAKIKATYQLLLERYPDCKAAGAARNWLKKNR